MFLTSLYFALLKFGRPPRRILPRPFHAVTTAVVAPAVVICLNSLILTRLIRHCHRDYRMSNAILKSVARAK